MSSTLTPPALTSDNATRKKREAAPEPSPAVSSPGFLLSPGDIVLWFHPGGQQFPAIVRRVNGNGALCLTVFNDRPTVDPTRAAVHHVSEADSLVSTDARRSFGLWDFTDRDKKSGIGF